MRLIAPNPETRIAFDHRYTPKALLTPSEARFHQCLDALSQQRCRILCKPRLADVFQHHDLTGFNKVSQKHIDFLICRNDDWMPMLGIELDDDSHERKERKVRDVFVNSLFASVGLPLIRIHVREMDQIEALLENLSRAWVSRWKTLDVCSPSQRRS